MSTDYSTDFVLVYEEDLDNAKKKSPAESSIYDKWRAKFMVNLRKNGLELEEVRCIYIHITPKVIIFPISDEESVLLVYPVVDFILYVLHFTDS